MNSVYDPADWLELFWEDLSKQYREVALAPHNSWLLFFIHIQRQGDLVRLIRFK